MTDPMSPSSSPTTRRGPGRRHSAAGPGRRAVLAAGLGVGLAAPGLPGAGLSVLGPRRARAQDAPAPSWDAVLAEARGQTVYFNAWGGSERINDYIAWAGETLRARHGVTLRHVKVADIAESVARVLAEKTAGRDAGGSVDLMWINGENFAAMKGNGLLGPPFVEALPNFALVDTDGKPTTLVDFTVPTDGLEAPWGMAQLVFMYDTARLPTPPASAVALADRVAAGEIRFAYPRPPAFLGTTFLKQVLLAQTPDRSAFAAPAGEADVAAATAPLWAYLDRLHPHLWRGGRAFPDNGPALIRLLGDAEIDVAFSFNPGDASAAIADGQLPDTVRSFVFDGGMLGNTHFVAIPFNASARAGAMVTADFLLSPEAQARKLDPRVWGDPTVLDVAALTGADRALFEALPSGVATLSPAELGPTLPEPHPSWTQALETEWQSRYGR